MYATGYIYKNIHRDIIYDRNMSINKRQINCGIVTQWKNLAKGRAKADKCSNRRQSNTIKPMYKYLFGFFKNEQTIAIDSKIDKSSFQGEGICDY